MKLTLKERMEQKLKEKQSVVVNHSEEKAEKKYKLNKEIALIDYSFEDLTLDTITVDYLKEQTLEIKKITNKAYTDLGKIFTETADKLSQKGYGCFEAWYTEIGFKKQTVYNYMNRYKLIVQRLDKQEIIESLPLKLAYTISIPDFPTEMIDKVLNLELKTYKELVEYKKQELELEEKEKEVEIVDKVSHLDITKEYQDLSLLFNEEKTKDIDDLKKKKVYEYMKKIKQILSN